jgi:hypothetical protein
MRCSVCVIWVDVMVDYVRMGRVPWAMQMHVAGWCVGGVGLVALIVTAENR